jgi:hypothetical protein
MAFALAFWLAFGFWLVGWSNSQKKVFGRWFLKQLKSWLLSQNEKAAPTSFLSWLLACWPTFSLINIQPPIFRFTKHLYKQLAF